MVTRIFYLLHLAPNVNGPKRLGVCVEVLRPSQPNGVMSSAVRSTSVYMDVSWIN